MFWSVTIQCPFIDLVLHTFSKADENTFYHSVAVGSHYHSIPEWYSGISVRAGSSFHFFKENKIQQERLYSSGDI